MNNQEQAKKASIKRLSVVAFIFLGIAIILGGRYAYLQLVKADHLQEKTAEQRVKKIVDTPERGKILDRNGNVMAMNKTAQSIDIYPNMMKTKAHQEKVIKLFTDVLELDEKEKKELTKKVTSGEYWASVAKNVPMEKVDKIKKAKIGGIQVNQTPKRYYPNTTVGASIIGFTNSENEPGAGIELSMNSYLSGTKGYTMAEVDSKGNVIPIGYENKSSAVDGQNLTLTIDSYMQYVLEKRLKKAQKEMNPTSMHVIVMEPSTGNVLAMASTPTYNPNKYDKYKSSTWTNNPTSFVYEPGSTFKPIFMAQALELKTITKDSTWFDNSGYISINGTNLYNFDKRGIGKMTLESIITNSSNVGMSEISRTMTSEQIVDSLKSRGIGSKTGIQLPGEESGIIATAKQLDNDPLMKATMSFGQGVATTPIQLITAFSELVNGGKDINANLVSKVEDNNGNLLYEKTGATGKQAYREEVSDLMKQYLKANSEVGSGKLYQFDGYEAGAKTGSAWVVSAGSNTYEDGSIIGSFMGFVPYENPKYAMLVVVDRPEGIEFGGPAAGPIFKDVLTEYLRYEAVEKEKKVENEEKTVKLKITNTEGMYLEDAKALLEEENKDVEVKVEGKGKVVVEQRYTYKKGTTYVTLETKKINDKNFTYMPSLKDKTKVEVEKIFEGENIEITFHGTGKVVETNLKVGRNEKTNELKIWMK